MFVTAKIKVKTTSEQHQILKDTMTLFNVACNHISAIAFKNKCYAKVKLQKLCYYPIREEYPTLSSQMVIRAIAKVCEAYKVSKKTKCRFRLNGAIVYDQRILSLKGLEFASLSTIQGRLEVPMIVSHYHLSIMKDQRIRGQADLVFVDNAFYLLFVIEVPKGEKINTTDVLGIDIGIVNIASDSDGQFHSGTKVNNLRKRYARIRAKLQALGTKSAKRKLKRRAKREQRMARDVNYCIAKKIVEKDRETLFDNCVGRPKRNVQKQSEE
ncbi:MAG: transposase [Bacilli bacterium]